MKTMQPNHNGLTRIALDSQVPARGALAPENQTSLERFIKAHFDSAPALAVFYLDYGIRFAKWENGRLNFINGEPVDPGYLQEARIFSADRELRIWREDNTWRYRLRIDAPGGNSEAVEARQNLWGTHAEALGHGWTRLWEDRGIELVVPLAIREKKDDAGPLAYLTARNYIDFMENGQATYVDCRFVGIGEREG
jgi:CRISPR-associated protein (TIGR03984 family)